MHSKVFFISGLLVSLGLHAQHFERLKAIESPCFSRLCGVVASGPREFIVVDDQQCTLMRCDWEGNLLGTLGQKGQGPGDLAFPVHVSRYRDKILVLDLSNARLFETDTKLAKPSLYKLGGEGSKMGMALNEDLFLCERSFHCKIGEPRLALRNRKGDILGSFFTACAVDPRQFGNAHEASKASLFMTPVVGVDHEQGRLLVSFSIPANPMALYLYSLKGDTIRTFQHPLPAPYRYPVEHPKTLNGLKGTQSKSVKAIFWHQGCWLVFVTTSVYQDVTVDLTIRNIFGYMSSTTRCYVFDHRGTFVTHCDFDFDFRPCDITDDGLILGISKDGAHREPSSGDEAVLIYRFHPKNCSGPSPGVAQQGR